MTAPPGAARPVAADSLPRAAWHWNGNVWTAYGATSLQNALYSAWGTSGSNLFAVGRGGTILHYDGASWTAQTSGVTVSLFSVHGLAADDVWAVGNGGTALHYDGSVWTSFATGSVYTLNAVFMVGHDDVWAVGGQQTLLHWTGSSWTSVTPPSGTAFGTYTSLWGASGTLWGGVSGAGNSLLSYDATSGTWTALKPTTVSLSVMALWGSSSSDAWAFTSNGGALHFDGLSWTPVSLPNTTGFLGAFGVDGQNVWGVGTAGIILRYRP